MVLSIKYIILYTGAGFATGYFSHGNKSIGVIGACVAFLLGCSFGISYGAISAVEFGIGLGAAALIRK